VAAPWCTVTVWIEPLLVYKINQVESICRWNWSEWREALPCSASGEMESGWNSVVPRSSSCPPALTRQSLARPLACVQHRSACTDTYIQPSQRSVCLSVCQYLRLSAWWSACVFVSPGVALFWQQIATIIGRRRRWTANSLHLTRHSRQRQVSVLCCQHASLLACALSPRKDVISLPPQHVMKVAWPMH